MTTIKHRTKYQLISGIAILVLCLLACPRSAYAQSKKTTIWVIGYEDHPLLDLKKNKIVAEPEQHPLFALKTNLLFDAMSAINVEVEIPIGKRWSVAGEWVFPWWLYEKEQYALQMGNGNLEVKYWFGDHRKHGRLTGWFIGLYGGGGYYDIEWKVQGRQGEFWHAGLSGGYALTINRRGNWRMEYTLGLGYMGTGYREYVPEMGADNRWHLMRRGGGHLNWIGPTRVKVSLMWMINYGHRRKGGER